MAIHGKGFYLWKVKATEGGDPDAIARTAREAGLDHVLIKVADGPYRYNYDWRNRVDLALPVIRALKAAAVSPWGWHYVRGADPAAEARVAADRVLALDLDGYVIDAESEYKGRREQARDFMKLLRRELPSTPIALSSYRYPSLHPTLPWSEFVDRCDILMPQVYWQGSANPAYQLRRTVSEYRRLSAGKILVPTGAAYAEHGWQPDAHQVLSFIDQARRLDLPAVNFWEWTAARALGLWEVVRDAPFGGQAPPAPAPAPPPLPPSAKDITEHLFDALNSRRPDNVAALYSDNAVHVGPLGTSQGVDAIRVWYARLYIEMLPLSSFQLKSFSGSGAARSLTWEAESQAGRVLNGQDTLGLVGDRIAFHYSRFSVTE